MNWLDYRYALAALFDQGGLTLWAILVVSILLWSLIIERYYFHRFELPGLRQTLRHEWLASTHDVSNRAVMHRLRALVGMLGAETGRNQQTLQALTGVLPLLGLLGTVSGMIKVFEVITVFGTGNTRGMASGISEALITTMAGLFTALSGIYFVSDLANRAEEASRSFEAELVDGDK